MRLSAGLLMAIICLTVRIKASSGTAEIIRQNCHQMLSITYRFTVAIQVANCRKRGFDKVPHYLDSNTRMLDLKSNNIKRLVEESFQNYPHLVVLHLDSNEISEITRRAFIPLRNLEVLTLRDNLITLTPDFVPSAVFLPLQQLQSLRLDKNPLRRVPNFYFSPLRALRELRLNRSTALELLPDSFGRLYNLTTLDLSGCQLSTLHPNTENSFNNMTLVLLNLADNLWHCDCNIKWLVSWFKRQHRTLDSNGLMVDQPLCAGPNDVPAGSQSMKHVPLFGKATETRIFACAPKAHVLMEDGMIKSPLLVNKGENVTLVCGFEADPKGNTEWFQAGTKVGSHWQRFHYNQTQGKVFKTSLYINNAQISDSAVYRCSHRNARGQFQQTRELKVIESIESFGPLKITMIMLGAAALFIIVLTTLAIFVYCFYCRTYETSSRIVKQQQQPRSRQDEITDDEMVAALNPPANGSIPISSSSIFAKKTIDGVNGDVVKEQQATLKQASIMTSSDGLMERGSVSVSVPFGAELLYDSEHNIPPPFAPLANYYSTLPTLNMPNAFSGMSSFRSGSSATLPHMNNASKLGGVELGCPVHGSRTICSPCSFHHENRSETPQMQYSQSEANPMTSSGHMYGTLPYRRASAVQHAAAAQVVAAAAAAAATAGYQPCPLHGDFSQYATLPATTSLMSNATATSTLLKQPHQRTTTPASAISTGHHHHHHKQSVSFAEPEQLELRMRSPSLNSTGDIGQMRNSKSEDSSILNKKGTLTSGPILVGKHQTSSEKMLNHDS